MPQGILLPILPVPNLALGKAKAFGENDLDQFASIDQVLRAIIADTDLPNREQSNLRSFQVVDSIIKTDEDFVLHLAATAPNFSHFAPRTPIATQQGQSYTRDDAVYVLFPNPNVAKGLRAGLVLQEMQ